MERTFLWTFIVVDISQRRDAFFPRHRQSRQQDPDRHRLRQYRTRKVFHMLYWSGSVHSVFGLVSGVGTVTRKDRMHFIQKNISASISENF